MTSSKEPTVRVLEAHAPIVQGHGGFVFGYGGLGHIGIGSVVPAEKKGGPICLCPLSK